LKIVVQGDQITPQELRDRLKASDFRIKSFSVSSSKAEQRRKFDCELRWPFDGEAGSVPAVIAQIEQLPGIIELEWHPSNSGPQ
jgi:hypothetical protein